MNIKFPTTKEGIQDVSKIIISQIVEKEDKFVIKKNESSTSTAIFFSLSSMMLKNGVHTFSFKGVGFLFYGYRQL